MVRKQIPEWIGIPRIQFQSDTYARLVNTSNLKIDQDYLNLKLISFLRHVLALTVSGR